MPRLISRSNVLALALSASVSLPALCEPLSAVAAQQALQRHALAWDVRSHATSSLPGAVAIDRATLDRWLARADVTALQRAVSVAGIDLSREVVVFGDAGDSAAQRLVESLAGLATGRVHWLVGGVTEWTLAGFPLVESLSASAADAGGVAKRLAVPQQLVARQPPAAPRMADAARRQADGYAVSFAAMR